MVVVLVFELPDPRSSENELLVYWIIGVLECRSA